LKIALITNPAAGNARGPWQSQVRAKLAELGEIEFLTPESPQGTTEVVRDAEARGCALVIAAGGDGTLHRVINGLANPNTEIGIIPAGTANDLASHIGVPADAIAAASAIVNGGIRAIDAVKVNGIRIHTVGGFLLTADAALRGDRLKQRYRWLGPAAYKVGAAISIVIHGSKREVGALIANQPTMGGNLRLPCDSVVDDGRCEIVTFTGGSRIRLARALAAMSAGKPLPAGSVSWESVAATTIEFDDEVEWFGDGEGLGYARKFDIIVEHRALKIRGVRAQP
jgi:diacylglycerol kinase family enzyme